MWSDFDIIYTASIEEKMNFKEESVIFKCCPYTWWKNKRTKIELENEKYYPVGLFLSVKKSKFFKFIKSLCNQYYNSLNYQSISAIMFRNLFYNSHICDKFDIKMCNEDYYLPWSWNETEEFLVKKKNVLPLNNIGIHWFNGGDQSKEY